MRRRILLAIVGVTVLAMVLFAVPLVVAAGRLYRADQRTELVRQATSAALAVPASFATTGDAPELPAPAAGTRLALYDARGRRLQGAGPDTADLAVRGALGGAVTEDTTSGEAVVGVPLASEERVVAVVRAGAPTDRVRDRLERSILLMAALAVAVIGAAFVVARWQARRLAAPVGRLADGADRLGHGDFAVHVEPAGIDEVDHAASALNATAARLGDLVARERAFSAHAAHQLRTPLTGLRLTLETVPGAGDAIAQVDALGRTVEELLTLAREPAGPRDPIAVDALLADLEARWRGPLAAQGRPLRVAADASLPEGRAASSAVRQALDVLLDNASRHGRGQVSVRARDLAGTLALDVADEGPGLADGQADAAFAGRRRTATHGLGLPLARAVIEAEGGRLVVTRTTPGATFTIVLVGRPDVTTVGPGDTA